MTLTLAATGLLEPLAGTVGGLALFVVDPNGVVVHRWGEFDGTTFVAGADGPRPRVGAQRRVLHVELPDGIGRIFATFAAAGNDSVVPLLQQILRLASQREQIERDLESMNASSVQLLEQLSVFGETLPRMSAGETDAEIAAMGVKALLVAAGVEHALYVHYHPEADSCEVLAHAQLGRDGAPELVSYPFEITFPRTGIVADVLASEDTVVLRSRDDVAGQQDLPEALARRQVAGVPVTSGTGSTRVLLGALLVVDKIRNAYTGRADIGSEEGQVALSFAAMVGAVLGARRVAELGKELDMAQVIQSQILPETAAVVDGFELAGDYQTSRAVGGDYFDFLSLADGRTLAVIADVSGHNLASGMVMVSARATLRTLAARCASPEVLFTAFASGMHQDLERTERFLTAAAVALAPNNRQVEVVMAGHNDLLWYRKRSGTVKRVSGEGTILGFMADGEFPTSSITMGPGDFLALYTDGVTEATAPDGTMFGEERLIEVLASVPEAKAAGIIDAVFAAVTDFTGHSERSDDMTMVVIRALYKKRGRR